MLQVNKLPLMANENLYYTRLYLLTPLFGVCVPRGSVAPWETINRLTVVAGGGVERFRGFSGSNCFLN